MDSTSEQKTENQEKKKIVRGPRSNQKLYYVTPERKKQKNFSFCSIVSRRITSNNVIILQQVVADSKVIMHNIKKYIRYMINDIGIYYREL